MVFPTPERWPRISALLDAALELPPEERAAYLDEACADEPDLRREVEAFLDAEANAPDFLEGEAAEHAGPFLADATLPPPRPALSPGQQLGPYRVVDQIGEGGMSTVYRAERADGAFNQAVAVKLMRSGLGADDFVQRFLNERQILASLSHPNIARVFDGGATDNGRPYFVMEHVEGTPITTCSDERRLSIDARLRLFMQVCEAVQYAHQNLIVHRDLKPANILVTEAGTVKLLDFGIAKLISPEADPDRAEAPLTRTGLHLMTPEYAAPEQVKGEAVTTATDVYALGILLYELLTGHRPYRLQQRSPYEIVRAICDEEPTRPSTIVTQVREGTTARIEPNAVSATRGLDVDELKRTLSGDLDAIVLKALRKAPADRYVTVEAFADDIRRYLRSEPVHAHANSFSYRARKFAHRHRLALGAGALVLLLLVGYAFTVTWQAQQIARERDKAQAVTSFLTTLFQQTDPLDLGTAENQNVTVKQVIDRGAQRVRTEFANQPHVQAELATVIGRVYTSLGRYPQADSLFEAALATHRRLLDDERTRADAEHGLAYSLYRQNRFEAADSLYRRAIERLRASDGSRTPQLAPLLNGRALLLDEWGKSERAEALLRTSIAILQEHEASVPGTYYHNLAITLQNQDRYAEALAQHHDALAAFRREHGRVHPAVASGLVRMAFTYQRADSLAVAESLHTEALQMRRDLLPSSHPHIASSLVRLSWLLVERGKPNEAAPLIREGLTILRERLPSDHWQIAAAEGVQALVHAQQGRFEEAEMPLRRSFELFRDRFGTTDWRTRSAARALVQLYEAWGRTEQAAPYRESLAEAHRLSESAPPS